MDRNHLIPLVAAFLLAAVPGAFSNDPGDAPGQEGGAKPPAASPPASAPRPETHRVAKESLRIEVPLTGTLEAQRKGEVVLKPEAWSGYVVERAAEPGARVKKGDPLVVFKTDRIDEEIADLRGAIELSHLGLDVAADELRWMKETAPLELTAAVRARQQAEEDLQRLLEVDGPLTERSAKNSLLNAEHSVEYASEELRQLEKMYKADDLTEETEEIILTRARRDVENARFGLEATRARTESTLKLGLPRQKEGAAENARRQEIALGRATAAAPRAETKKRLELEKQRSEHEKTEKRLEKLRRDRESMTLEAPQDGVVYYGRFARGKWLDAATLLEELRPGSTVSAPGPRVLLTVVDPRPLSIRCDVAEKDLSLVRAGAEGRGTAAAAPQLKFPVRVERISAAPVAPGIYDARIAADLGEEAAALLPGMECAVRLTGYQNKEALTAPPGAVFAEEGAEERTYVFLLGKEGKAEKRSVKTGRRTESKVEILGGLAEGDEILLKKPEGAEDKGEKGK